jgi:hypothetical protein
MLALACCWGCWARSWDRAPTRLRAETVRVIVCTRRLWVARLGSCGCCTSSTMILTPFGVSGLGMRAGRSPGAGSGGAPASSPPSSRDSKMPVVGRHPLALYGVSTPLEN